MLKKPTSEELTELRRLGDNRIFRTYIQSALDASKDSLVQTPDIAKLRFLQGQASTLTDILRFITL